MFFFESRPYRNFSPLVVVGNKEAFLRYFRSEKYEIIHFDQTDNFVQLIESKKLPIYESQSAESVLPDDLNHFFTDIVAQLNITHLYLWESVWEQPEHYDLINSYSQLFDIKVFSVNSFIHEHPHYLVLGNHHVKAEHHLFSLHTSFFHAEYVPDFIEEEGYIIAGAEWSDFASSLKSRYPEKAVLNAFEKLKTDLRHYLY